MQRLSRMELLILIGNIWLLTSYTSFMYPIHWWTALPPGCLFLLNQVESWGMSLFIFNKILLWSNFTKHQSSLFTTRFTSAVLGSTNFIPTARLVPWWGGKSTTLELRFCVLLVLPTSTVSPWQGSHKFTISLHNEHNMLHQSSLSSPSSGVASVSSSLMKGWRYLLACCSSISHP